MDETAIRNKIAQELAEAWRQKIAEANSEIALRRWCVEHSRPDLSPIEIMRFVTEPFDQLLRDK